MIALAPLAASAVLGAGKALAGKASESLGTHLQKSGSVDPKAKKTADDFEKMFLEQTLDRLNAGEGTEGPLGENGTGGGVYRSMLSQQYAGQIVKSGGVGISGAVYNEILKLQGSGK